MTLSICLGTDAQVIIENGDTIASIDDVKGSFPSATGFTAAGKGIYSVKAGRETIGKIVLSDHYAKEQGFAGPTPLLIAFGTDGKVKDVVLLRNDETPGFVKKVKRTGLFTRWNGLSAKDAASMEVDAVSGATYTSMAVINTIRRTLSSAKINFAEKNESKPSDKDAPNGKTDEATTTTADADKTISEPTESVDTATTEQPAETIAAYDDEDTTPQVAEPSIPTSILLKNCVITLMALTSLVLYFFPKKTHRLRRWFLALSVVVLGFWQSSMLSVAQFIGWMHTGIPVSMQWGMLVLAVLAIVVPLFFKKKYYCIYVCPFGAAQELAGMVNKKHRLKISDIVLRWLLVVRKAIFVAVIITIILGVNFQIGEYEPFALFNVSLGDIEGAPVVALCIAVVSLLVSTFISRPWCRFVCPVGQGLDLLK